LPSIAAIAAIAAHCRPIAAIAAHCRPLPSATIGGNGWQWTAMTSKGGYKKTKKVSIKWHLTACAISAAEPSPRDLTRCFVNNESGTNWTGG